MRAYQLADRGLDGLRPVELPVPEPGTHQVLVRIRAASLNYRDLLVATNRYGRRQPTYPIVPLSDGAGEVVAVGKDVRHLAVGDRVMGNFFQRWIDGPFDPMKGASALGGAIPGVLAEFVLFEEMAAVKFSSSLSFEEASTLPCAGLTAWMGLVVQGELKAGESVLAMGTGGVSIFSLQIAKALGARVLLTSSSDAKLARGRELGADDVINYRTHPEWDARVLELTSGRGVDHLLEVGGDETLPRSLRAVREGGHLTLIGLLSGSFPDLSQAAANDRGVRVDSVYVGSADQLRSFCSFVLAHSLRPLVDRLYPFDEARAAYECLQAGQHLGKIVIRV